MKTPQDLKDISMLRAQSADKDRQNFLKEEVEKIINRCYDEANKNHLYVQRWFVYNQDKEEPNASIKWTIGIVKEIVAMLQELGFDAEREWDMFTIRVKW